MHAVTAWCKRWGMKPDQDVACLGAAQTDDEIAEVAQRYAVAITPAMASLIQSDDPADPIARQFVPDVRELEHGPGENADPIGDEVHEAVPGLVHRYPDRVLLKAVSVCAVYCRFCFRREMVGPASGIPLTDGQLRDAVTYIRNHSEIWEVILSGGDPLVLSPRRISQINAALGDIPHVKVIRWHSRVPVVQPERITAALVNALKISGKAVFVALHANHPRELTVDARAACGRLVDAGIPMVSQSVLLRGVNDDAATLEALMRAFVETRIKPYYLHHLDRAPGTGHFRTRMADGQALMTALRGRVSGLCQPAYMLDIPGGHGKVPISPSYLVQSDRAEPDGVIVRDPSGVAHFYRDDPED